MTINEMVLILSTLVMPILSGVGSYIMSIKRSQKDINQLREQNKLDIEKLMNQHRMDLEALERKHQMEVEKMEIDHKHNLELKQKEMENKIGGEFFTEIMSGLMNSPEMRAQINKSLSQGIAKKRR